MSSFLALEQNNTRFPPLEPPKGGRVWKEEVGSSGEPHVQGRMGGFLGDRKREIEPVQKEFLWQRSTIHFWTWWILA